MSRNIKKAFRCKCSIKINFFSFFFTSPYHVVVGNFLRAFSSSLVSQRAFSVEKFRFIDCAWKNGSSYQAELSQRRTTRSILHLWKSRMWQKFTNVKVVRGLLELVYDSQCESSSTYALLKGIATKRLQPRAFACDMSTNLDHTQHSGRIFAEGCILRSIIHQ